jgi:hypothetical protein
VRDSMPCADNQFITSVWPGNVELIDRGGVLARDFTGSKSGTKRSRRVWGAIGDVVIVTEEAEYVLFID